MKPKVLFVTAELTPVAKVGGLADVAEALPKALNRARLADARIVIPFYKEIRAAGVATRVVVPKLMVPTREGKAAVQVLQATISGNTVYLLRDDVRFGTGDIYLRTEQRRDPFAEMRRFLFFAQAVAHLIDVLPGFRPDVLHCHDWHTGFVPLLIQHAFGKKAPATVFTIHNLAMQGRWNRNELLAELGLTADDSPTLAHVDAKNDLAAIEQGILTSDVVTTVSRTYAREILTAEYGAGMQKTLRKRKRDLYGIVNGIDVERFNPASDPALAARYGAQNSGTAKQKNKAALQRRLGLAEEPDIPLFGFVGRLTGQKGMELINSVFPEYLVNHRAQLVVLGTGDHTIERAAADLARIFPRYASATLNFDAALANQIYAGSDFFLMPSKFEPCGLGQLIALRYGSVPIVRATGGLVDTVQDYQENPKRGLGFCFKNFSGAALSRAIYQARTLYTKHPKEYHTLQQRGMRQDLSWDRSAPEYATLYARALRKRKRTYAA